MFQSVFNFISVYMIKTVVRTSAIPLNCMIKIPLVAKCYACSSGANPLLSKLGLFACFYEKMLEMYHHSLQ